jgi:hypothetical protein
MKLPPTSYSPSLGDVHDFSQFTAVVSSFVTPLNPGDMIHILHLKKIIHIEN